MHERTMITNPFHLKFFITLLRIILGKERAGMKFPALSFSPSPV
jgi:hypothetical protein